jgi:hypothetical protein
MRITVPLVKPPPKTLKVPPLSVEMRFGSIVVTTILGKGVGDDVAVPVGVNVAVAVDAVADGVTFRVAVGITVTVEVICNP